MTDLELSRKWPREQFEQWKAEGFFAASTTYKEYMAMRREQYETTVRELEALKAQYGEYPNEQPPELTEEDHRLLSECWAEARQEQSKLAA